MISPLNISALAASVKAATSGDPYWNNVSLLLHGEALIDSSSNALTFTNSGVSVSTANQKYGTGSLYFNGSSYLYSNASSNLDVYGKNFTIEFFFNATSISNNPYLVELYASDARIPIGIDPTYGPWFNIINALGSQYVIGAAPPSLSVWHHLAAVVTGNTMSLYLDGQLLQNKTITYAAASRSYSVHIGYYSLTQTQLFNGYIDELRITNGIARYTANFTPPTQAFPNN